MAEKFYTYTLDANTEQTGKPDGIHEYGGPALEKKIEECVQKHFPGAYFEEQEDGSILIFASEQDAADEAAHVGTATLVS